ncbi:MAG TPA: cyclic nucleotide-binding domain-containing protein, partial [Candidatus Bathyarchaeia archaeon]|nr:cyclic nucleotide-binding domain-containing protein [Candidatus Bathyarchaeia archaeon]
MNSLSSLFKNYRLVRQIPVFAKLNWYDVQRIASKAQVLHFAKGQALYRQGEPSTGFYCLLSGRVQAYCLDSEGKKFDVEFFRRGMFFGIVSLLTGEAHSMTFEAMNDSQVLFIPRESFLPIVRSMPQLNVEFTQSLSRRLHARSKRGNRPFLSKIISVYSPMKAAGTSTYAFYLANQIYRQAKASVLLIRVASALPSGMSHSGIPDRGYAALEWRQQGRHLDEIVGDEELIRAQILSGNEGVDLLAACFYPDDHLLVSRISDFVTTLALEYDYIVVDLPNDADEVVMKTLTQSDEVHLLAKDDAEELKMVRKMLNDLEEQLKQNFSSHHVRVLLKSQPNLTAFSFEQIRELIDYDMYARLPYLSDDELTEPRDFNALWARFPKAGVPFDKEMVKIAREVSGVRVGLVLGGGAALGVAHIGVLRVLEREHIPVDIIAGSSMGALVASLWATEYDAECLTNIAQQFRDQKALLKLFDPVVPISGMIGG